jgi:predicted HD superfamily hydrolase involved in NAD metabolism
MMGLTMDETVRQRIVDQIARLPAGVQAHIEQVRRAAVELALLHWLDVARAELAAQAHDICRLVKGSDLIDMAGKFGLTVTALDRAVPVFLHGPVGAEVLRRDYGIDDEAVLDAVRCHTMGRAGMAPLEKLLFLADKLDPSKVSRYPFITEVGLLARKDLDKAMLRFIDEQSRVFIETGSVIHPGMNAARTDALLEVKKAG